MARWNRRPRFPIGGNFAALGKRRLFFKASVNPGETQTELRSQIKVRTDAAAVLDTPAYLEIEFYYVPLRLIDEGFPDFLISSGALTVGTYATQGAADQYLSQNGALAWEQGAFSVIAENYWAIEDYANTAGYVKNPETDHSIQQTVEDADVDITTATTTNQLDEKYGERDFEVRRQSWEGNYRRFLQNAGVTVKEDALSVPERIMRYRRFIEPATIVDPSTSDYASVWTADIDRMLKKPIYFAEHGIILGFISLTPRIMLDDIDPASFITDPEQFPIPGMLNAHCMSEEQIFLGGASTERISTNEYLWSGRSLIAGGEEHASRGNLLVLRPASRIEVLYSASVVASDLNGTGFYNPTTDLWEDLDTRVFGGSSQTSVRYQGLCTQSVKTTILRVGSDWRLSVYLGANS